MVLTNGKRFKVEWAEGEAKSGSASRASTVAIAGSGVGGRGRWDEDEGDCGSVEWPSANKTEEHEEEREAESEEELDDDIVSLARNVAGVAERRPDAEPWRSRVDDIFYSPKLPKLNFAISQESQMNEEGKEKVLWGLRLAAHSAVYRAVSIPQKQ